jgi:hypothetical protein
MKWRVVAARSPMEGDGRLEISLKKQGKMEKKESSVCLGFTVKGMAGPMRLSLAGWESGSSWAYCSNTRRAVGAHVALSRKGQQQSDGPNSLDLDQNKTHLTTHLTRTRRHTHPRHPQNCLKLLSSPKHAHSLQ